MAAAGRRDVGEDLAAAAGYEPGEGLGLDADHGREDSVTFTIVIDGSIVDVRATRTRIQVDRQHSPGGRARVIHRHRGRLVRRIGGQGAGMPRGVSAPAVARDPDVRRTGERGRDRTPGRLSGMRRKYRRALWRVARGQYGTNRATA